LTFSESVSYQGEIPPVGADNTSLRYAFDLPESLFS
jgi:hypothetical protein